MFASTHGGACHALTTFMVIASSFGLKVVAVGADVSHEDCCLLRVCGSEIEHVSELVSCVNYQY